MSTRYDLSAEEYTTAREALARSIELAGGQTKFAEVCGCTQGNISQLLAKGSLLPSRYATKVEASLGVPREDLRPDVFAMLTKRHPPVGHEAVVARHSDQGAFNHAHVLPKAPAND